MKYAQTDWGITLPLLDAAVGIKDIYSNSGNSFIRQENDQSFTFVYTKTATMPQQQFVTIPPFVVSYALNVDAGTALVFNNAGSFSNALSNYVVAPTTNGEKLKQVFIKKGFFSIHLTSDILHNTSLVITFPTITAKNGDPLQLPLVLHYTTTNPAPADTTIRVSLDDHTIDFTDGGISYNVLPYEFELSLNKIPGNPDVVAGNTVVMTQTFQIDEYRGINGYVGRFELTHLKDSNSIDMFQNQYDVSVKLKDPRLKFKISSGFGIPVTIKINKISLINLDGTEFPIVINFLKDTFTLPAPTVIGTFAVGEYSIDRSNSNFDDIINNSLQNAPKGVNYDIQVFSNYNGVEVDNFMFDTSSLQVDVGMEIPLDLKVSNFSYPIFDTLSWINDTTFYLTSAGFYSQATNTLPLDLRVQVYFGKWNTSLKDSFEMVDSLFQNGWILSKATVDTNGTVVSSNPVTSEALMDRNKYAYLRDVAKCNRFKVLISFETSRDVANNQQYVKIFNYQGLGLRLGVKAKGKYTAKVKK